MLAIIHGNVSSPLTQQIMTQIATEKDQLYCNKFKRLHRQQQSLLGRCLLRGLLSLQTKTQTDEWAINSHEDSGLILSHPTYQTSIYGSISHSHDIVVAALSDHGPIGIDIEAINPNRDMDKILNSLKQIPCVYIPSTLNNQYTLWTVFEAYIKASKPLKKYAIPSEMIQSFKDIENTDIFEMIIENTKYIFKTIRLNDFVITVCATRSNK